MKTQVADHRPYASTSNVLDVLHRLRSRNLPETIGPEFYQIVGLPDQAIGRTRDALIFLGLIDANGRPSERLSRMTAETEDEYRKDLEDAIRMSYADALEVISPESDTSAQIQDWFRRYQPRSQTRKMAGLFLGLCKEAGVPVREAPRAKRNRQETKVIRLASTKRGTSGGRPTSSLPDTDTSRSADVPSSSPSSADDSLAFGITAQDVAALSDDDFEEVWKALGKIARARAKSVRQDAVDNATPAPQEAPEEE